MTNTVVINEINKTTDNLYCQFSESIRFTAYPFYFSGELKIMITYFFWDIENVSFHNLEKIMQYTGKSEEEKLYVIYSKIKEARKVQLTEEGWILIQTENPGKNSADYKIQEMIELILNERSTLPMKIFLITEDKGFSKISRKIIENGIELEVICGTKDPQWIKDLKYPGNLL